MVESLNQLLASFQKTYQETVLSSQKMHSTASKLMNLADEIDSRESGHKGEDNYDAVHSKTAEIKDASDSLEELSERLQTLSRQLKYLKKKQIALVSGKLYCFNSPITPLFQQSTILVLTQRIYHFPTHHESSAANHS